MKLRDYGQDENPLDYAERKFHEYANNSFILGTIPNKLRLYYQPMIIALPYVIITIPYAMTVFTWYYFKGKRRYKGTI